MHRDPLERFDTELEAWARRAPERTPEEAAGLLLDRLAEREEKRTRRAWTRPAWALAHGVAALALAAVLLLRFGPELVRPGVDPSQPAPSRAARPAADTGLAHGEDALAMPPLPEEVLVMWLDSETPLYLTLSPTKLDPT